MGKLKGRVAIITGAASGIGRASAQLFAEAGATVVLADVSDKVNETLELVTKAGGRGVAIVGDVATTAVLDKTIEAAEMLGGVDIMFANAGVSGGLPGLFELTAEHCPLASGGDWHAAPGHVRVGAAGDPTVVALARQPSPTARPLPSGPRDLHCQ